MAYDNLVNGSCFRIEKNVTGTVISHVGRHITCDVKGNCCLAFSSVGKKEGNLKINIMKNLKYKGFTYTVIIRPWKKGKSKYEVIKYKTGFRNLWSRTNIDEYNKVSKLIALS